MPMKTLLVLLAAAHLPILAPQDWWPVFSPDGGKVAFTQVTGRTMTLEVVDRATKRTVKIAANQYQLSPSWSSDGRLAFSLGGRIYTSDANGTHRAAVTSAGRSFAPAWRPHSTDIAYLTTVGAKNTDLWVSGTLWARDAYGKPGWSPDGSELAFQRDDGIYVATGPGAVSKIASSLNPQAPVWSPDGEQIAYVAARRIWIAASDGSSSPRALVSPGTASSDPAWTPDGVAVVYTTNGELSETTLRGYTSRRHAAMTAGATVSPVDGAIAFTGPHPGCTDHTAILLFTHGSASPLGGTCEILGTPGNDVIRARNGQRDIVLCGPGRDTVYADRSDVLRGCEIVHRR